MSDINASTGPTIIEEIDRLKEELDKLRPLPADVVGRIEQKLRLESNYHSNAIEGNSLTLGETRSLILHGLTAHGKPMRDHLDIEGHDGAVKAIEDAVERNESLNEVFIRNLHRVLLKEPYENDAITPEGQPTKRLISIGEYKTQPNNVRTSTGEIYYFASPEQVKPAMSDLIDWYRKKEKESEHPIVMAATVHYRFIRIHPFDDGNGRMARLLMNMILIKHGYTVAIIPIDQRDQYIQTLEQVDKDEDLAEFITYVSHCCEYALNLHLKAARGEDIEDVEDIDKEIAFFKRSLQKGTTVGPDHRSLTRRKDKTARTVIDKLVGDIIKSVNPLQIILFGSAARGDTGEHSDIDLLVVMPEGVHRRRTAQKLYREITGLGVPFDIVVATPQDLEKHKDNRGLIYKSALKEGIEIYGL